eukprot:6262689-Prymnesium_polylepis.1
MRSAVGLGQHVSDSMSQDCVVRGNETPRSKDAPRSEAGRWRGAGAVQLKSYSRILRVHVTSEGSSSLTVSYRTVGVACWPSGLTRKLSRTQLCHHRLLLHQRGQVVCYVHATVARARGGGGVHTWGITSLSPGGDGSRPVMPQVGPQVRPATRQ